MDISSPCWKLLAFIAATVALVACAEEATESEGSIASEPATVSDAEAVLPVDEGSKAATSDEIVVYTAKKIVTMDTSLPTANAVAVV